MTEARPVIALLRGWMRDRRHWEDFPTRLDDMLNRQALSARILLPDLAGNGERHQEISPPSIAAMVQDVRQHLAAEVAASPLILVGLSMGGMIAAEWARSHPAEVRALCLINTSLRPWAQPWERLRPGLWPEIVRELTVGTPDSREGLILRVTLSEARQTEARLACWQHWLRQRPVQPGNILRQLGAAARYRYAGSPPDCPTLIISAQGDRLVAPICSERVARAWHCPHVSHPQAGHDLPVEQPEWLADRLCEWLRSTRLRG